MKATGLDRKNTEAELIRAELADENKARRDAENDAFQWRFKYEQLLEMYERLKNDKA